MSDMMLEILNDLFIGIFLYFFARIVEGNPVQINEVQLNVINVKLKQGFKGIPQYYLDKVQPILLGSSISLLFLAKGIELCSDYTGVSLYFRLVFYSLIAFYLVWICLSIPVISKKLGRIYDEWSFKYKKHLFKYFVIPAILLPLTVKFLYDFIVLTMQIFYS